MIVVKAIWLTVICVVVSHAQSELPAFPGAEGFGKYTSGGRGGEVYHVTNLDDSGPGSFRDAVSQSNRIVVFDVGGVIHIGDRIVIKNDIYVAGQTAPGGGITIYGNGVALNDDSGNNIIRYIRIRMGKNGDDKKDALAISAGQDYILDHVSISWGIDGTLDVNGSGIDNLTFQNCIIGQGINIINHSTGGLMQSGKWSIIRSLYIDNKTRNPKARGTHECINSVLYNWASNGYVMGDTEGRSECNLIGNYFIYGPSSSSNSHITRTTSAFHVYGEDNWVDANKNGTLDGSLMTDYKTATVVGSPFDHPGVNTILSAQDALAYVIENAGASKPRDAVDEFLIDELVSYGTKGQIIDTEDDNGIPNNVGTVANGTPPVDTDKDGMPDSWEHIHGLDPNDANDRNGTELSAEGYTNVEMYLSEIAGDFAGTNRNTLTTSVASGEGTISPAGGELRENQEVAIEAIPSTGWLFDHWSGDLSGDVNPAILIMAGDKSVEAHFVEDTRPYYTVSAQAAPGGSVSQTPEGAELAQGTSVTFTATPNKGWTFDGWSGEHTGTDAAYTLPSLSSNVSLSATFTPVDMYVYEAEHGILNNAVREADNAGFSGESYVNFDNDIGSSVDIAVFASSAGSTQVTITFANGSEAPRPMSVSVDGTQQIASVDFETTADWTNWQQKQISLDLSQGASIVTFSSIGLEGGPNIDMISLKQGGTSTKTHKSMAKNNTIFYNPSQRSLCVQVPSVKVLKVSIFSLDGKRLQTHKFTDMQENSRVSMPLGNVKAGVYLVRYQYNGSIMTGRVNIF